MFGLTYAQLNDDMFNDIVVSLGEEDNFDETASLYVLYGGLNFDPHDENNTSLPLPPESFGLTNYTLDFGVNIHNVGDVNDDGFQDFLTSTSSSGAEVIVLYFEGQPNFPGETDEIDILQDPIGIKLYKLGDINGDNIDDFAVSMLFEEITCIFFGDVGVTDFSEPDLTMDFEASNFNTGQDRMGIAATTADVNNDSFDNFLMRPVRSDSTADEGATLFLFTTEAIPWIVL